MEELIYLPPTDIIPNPYQPRQQFDPDKLQELAQSIQMNGIIQPLIVRKSAIHGYELLAGERRLRASKLAGLETVPVIVKDLTDTELLNQAIIENLQRSDLNPIEEAHSYQRLIERGMTHDEIAGQMGKSRPYISNILRLLQLSPASQEAVESGRLSQGHARLLIGLSKKEQQDWIETIEKQEMSVRKLESILAPRKKKGVAKQDLFKQEIENQLRKRFGTLVQIHQKANGQGKLSIHFSNLEELERLINNLK
ncbi:ParB/RepB/Spo0J family partition protein [Streptococcus suis]|nr:ParB/RepB/Spo0J family partition protein [Streptococcus suis]